MSEESKSYPIVVKCKRCGNLLGTFSESERARSTIKCKKCGAENLVKAQTVSEDTEMKRDRLFPRRV